MKPSDPKFRHPYDPYDIQLGFMSSLYDCIQNGQVGIFESPTGTGKSLSLICGSLTWLRDHKRRTLEGEIEGDATDPDDWLAQAEKQNRRKTLLREREELEAKLAKVRWEEARRKDLQANGRPPKRPRRNKEGPDAEDEEHFMLEDYESDTDNHKGTPIDDGLSASTRVLLEKLRGPKLVEEEVAQADELKVIFSSRTHSQLTQFVHELRRVKPPPGMPIEETEVQDVQQSEAVKHLALGSRKNLCINEKVSRLASTTAVNERCLDLQKPGIAKDKKCPYLPTKDDREVLDAFRTRSIAQVRDIEDIAKLGREMEICPYYASRPAIAPSEVLTLPYPLLLQKSAREALGVSVKDNVVVIDEAHNLMDAIADTFSITLRLTQIQIATQQVTGYVQRFKNKLKGKNRVYVTQVIRLLNSITDCLGRIGENLQRQDVIVTASQLMSGKGVDQIKPHKLLQYLQESKLAYKVEGYTELKDKDNKGGQHKGLLMHFQSFLAALMNPDAEGRFFASRQDGNVVVRYTLLDPKEHFREIVQEARAVILAGGTMSPMSDYADHLFSYLPPETLKTFTFGHVIPEENMFARSVAHGPSGLEFDFTFEKRGLETMILELGKLLLRVVSSVPGGVVVFFPSYEYLARVVKIWKMPVNTEPLLQALGKKKQVFEEAKGVSVDDLLRDYAQAIDNGTGGLLLSVVGGKLSEGINFSDSLGRAVVCVGLPFPNANSGEWKAKIDHIESAKMSQCKEQGYPENEARLRAKAAGRDFYENACMRAVNQSIGRAIRHRNDYAAILLVDRRFATERIRSKLPGWIRESMIVNQRPGWEATEVGLHAFFRNK
ncbi:uncharacterized protein HMPREF1541_09295 [Cyphellophora europaea CBS 101466]|uniref:ATP-dependent DNA helicase CHL1 n=1 Tax=Cyphellophora europaea (strain CBS 101466) TaxID=1220924 RepID=W2SBS5_CYPE1|nr:uncharacterized protein HMPREF1541_09295 [Cyphellophora europaea CBS 101466]ETN45463.1 hypothetical protein HMPREF1541_09295 [Cyphellophora europaea CBS 101466]